MMRIFIVLGLACALSSCSNEPEAITTDMVHFPGTAGDAVDSRDQPGISFEEAVFNFGKVAEGEVVKHIFEFENTGDAPLVISKVEASCGCTVARDWPKDPIQPGKKGTIAVEFDSSKRPGFQKKTITVLANTVPSRNIIEIQGEVVGVQAQPE